MAGFLGSVFEVWPAPEAQESLQVCGVAKPPTFLKAFPGPRGQPDLKYAPQKSGQTAFRYPGSAEPRDNNFGNRTPSLCRTYGRVLYFIFLGIEQTMATKWS